MHSDRTRPFRHRRGARGRASAARGLAAFVLAFVLLPGFRQRAGAQEVVPSRRSGEAGFVGGEGSANYILATRFAPYRMSGLVHSTSLNPRWIRGTDKFWFDFETTAGKKFWIVDAARATKNELFDHDRIAAELTRLTRDPYDAQHLPITTVRFINDHVFQFDVTSSQDEETTAQADTTGQTQQQGARRPPRPKKKVFHFEYDVNTRTLRELENYEAPDNHPSWASVSPDGQTVVFARENNLWMMTGDEYQKILDARRGKSGAEADSASDKLEVQETQLTTDGVDGYAWGFMAEQGTLDKDRAKENAKRRPAGISWAKDSKRFATVRADDREVGMLWVIHNTGNKRPELESYHYDMPGDTAVEQNELWYYDLAARRATQIDDHPWKDQAMSLSTDIQFFYPDATEPRRSLWMSPNSDELYFTRRSRDRHRLDLLRADLSTGEVKALIEERLNTYLEEMQRPMHRLLSNGDILWWSEEDGRGHLYLYDHDGNRKARLTEGPWTVVDIMGVDETAGVVFFTAAGREEGIDPYYNLLYRVNLDGTGLRRIDEGDFDHPRTTMNESARFLVDSYSRVNTAPKFVLRNARGAVVLDLAESDFSKLMEAGWKMPEPFTVKAADGVTDLYGVMYKPFDFDSTKVYPIVEYVYPGPQTEAVAKSFSTSPYEVGLAQFGMIVITVGNRGGHPSRSKWYHNYGYGNLRDYGLADKKTAVEQLAERYAFIDQDRVGIYGHSGGGFMSTAAMLVYPDFFKVAVSSSGNHTNDIYNRWWSETHHGVKEVVKGDTVSFEYQITTNPEIAKNLKGHLLITTGDIDNNVHPANTIRLAEALIKANKRFDFFMFPGQRHGYGNMSDYWYWLRAEYFVKHLLGDTRWTVDINELNMQREQSR